MNVLTENSAQTSNRVTKSTESTKSRVSSSKLLSDCRDWVLCYTVHCIADDDRSFIFFCSIMFIVENKLRHFLYSSDCVSRMRLTTHTHIYSVETAAM